MRHSVLFVGESNPKTADPRYALYPWPSTSAGGRLAAHLGMSPLAYINRTSRVNLFALDGWNIRAARARAEFVTAVFRDVRTFVLLGSRVAKAFGFDNLPVWRSRVVGGRRYVRVPHPSGRCREWNDPRARTRLRRLLNPYLRGDK